MQHYCRQLEDLQYNHMANGFYKVSIHYETHKFQEGYHKVNQQILMITSFAYRTFK